MADSTKPVSVTVSPTIEELKHEVEKRRKTLADFRTPYARAAVYLDQWVQKNFKTEGGKVGGWKPFSEVTLRMIAMSDPSRQPAKLLQRTGRLRISFRPFADRDDAGIGTSLSYAKGHHEGLGRLPERKLLPTKDLVMHDIRKIFDRHVNDGLRGNRA